MIKTDANKSTLKAMRAKEKKEKDEELKAKCVALANERFGDQELIKLSNANKGLWFLPVMDAETGEIEKMALMKPIDRHILNYASTKIEGEGLYAFLEAAMRECFVAGDEEVLDDDTYFITAANSFNAILEGKKAAMLKR